MDPAAFVRAAAQRFSEGAGAPFLACFDEAVQVYWEPALSQTPLVSSRESLEAWLERTRESRAHFHVTMSDPYACGRGAVLEVILVQEPVPAEVWRLALAICVESGLISEVRAFWAREAAVEWLAGSR